jgi:hypothetical protein
MENEIYYKVLTPNKSQLQSARCGQIGSICPHLKPFRYVRNEWTKRKQGYGPLTCFNNKETALMFGHYQDNVVYECKIIPSNDGLLWQLDKTFEDIPKDTVLCEQIMITKRIKNAKYLNPESI